MCLEYAMWRCALNATGSVGWWHGNVYAGQGMGWLAKEIRPVRLAQGHHARSSPMMRVNLIAQCARMYVARKHQLCGDGHRCRRCARISALLVACCMLAQALEMGISMLFVAHHLNGRRRSTRSPRSGATRSMPRWSTCSMKMMG